MTIDDTRATVERIRDEYPDLSSNGWRYWVHPRFAQLDHEKWRENMTSPHSLGQFERAMNGMFIAAAIALGFTIKRIPESPNCWLNISSCESIGTRGDGKFMNPRSGKWMTFEETYGEKGHVDA
jgi:hypothetical protein